ncbi:MAG: hypothetical protein WCF57_13240 [Pyrinomonadaceae bacterium]
MSIKLQVIKSAGRACRRRGFQFVNVSSLRVAILVAAFLATAPALALAQEQTPPSSTPQPSTPAGTSQQGQQQQQPGAPPPSTTTLPPNSSSAPVRPGNEAQQSTQPQTGVEQERQQTTPNTQGPRPRVPLIQYACE